MLLSEWTSGRPFDQRVNNLRFGTGDFLDGSGVTLAGGTIAFNSSHDSLNGSTGQNLSFAGPRKK